MNNLNANDPAAAAAGAPSGGIPSLLDDPVACLNNIANRPASNEFWGMLAGGTASFMREEHNPLVCTLYLQAVAHHLPASDVDAPSAAASNNNDSSNMEAELIRAQRLVDILDAVGIVATKCHPRLTISQSGILRALLAHPYFKSAQLNQVQVEFCQVALLAEQYRFAGRVLQDTWPRPTSTVSVRHVLRYYLLRGMIHVGCNDWTMAIRCFWTCLSIPSEIVSALAVAAWKKLVLVQCLQMEDDDYRPMISNSAQDKQSSSGGASGLALLSGSGGGTGHRDTGLGRGPMSLPKALPTCFSRFLNMASHNKQQQQQAQQQQRSQPEELPSAGHMVQEELGESTSQQQQGRPPQHQQPQQPYAALGVRVYMDLVQAFLKGDRKEFQTLQLQHAALLEADGNLGLARQCETAMFQRQVYQLSRMFAVIPLADLASKLGTESEETTKGLLMQLSMKKTCGGAAVAGRRGKKTKWPNIEVQEDGMVVFNYSSTMAVNDEIGSMVNGDGEMERELDENIKELLHLTKQVEKLDVQIVTSPMYHALLRRANESKIPRGVEEL